MSRKFSPAQFSYKTWDREALAILEGFLRWEDKLLGRKVNVVTDHEALGFFKNQQRLTSRQTRWMEFLERFDYTIEYIQGEENKVADCLSRYFQSDLEGEGHPSHEYVRADVRLDPEGDDLPAGRLAEVRAVREDLKRGGKGPPTKKSEPRVAKGKARASVRRPTPSASKSTESVGPSLVDSEPTAARGEPPVAPRSALSPTEMESDFFQSVKRGYESDALFQKILGKPMEFRGFTLKDGFLYSRNRDGIEVLCVPRTMHGRRRITEILISEAHQVLGHLGSRKTVEYIRRAYWWPSLADDTAKYCASCGVCQTTKSSNQQPPGLLHPMPIPSQPWESIGMDFVGPFPPSKGHDYLWVVICRLTSMVHLIPVTVTIKASELAFLYLAQIVRLHGLPLSIVSDRDSKFTSKFWTELHRLVGTKLRMSTSFHPQTDGASERAIRSVSQILRSMVSADQTDWVEKVPLAEFAINSAVSASTGFSPFELNLGYQPRMVTAIPEGAKTAPKGIRTFVENALMNLQIAHDAIIESRVNQTHQANRRRRPEEPFRVGEEVYLSTADLNLPKGRARKLMPKFVGPYRVLESHPATSTYKLALPEGLAKRRIHPTFHVSKLRRCEKNDDKLFPHREAKVWYDFGDDDEEEWLVDAIIGHRWSNGKVEFQLRWNLGDTTWEPYATVKDLSALDDYVVLQGVSHWRSLPRRPCDA